MTVDYKRKPLRGEKITCALIDVYNAGGGESWRNQQGRSLRNVFPRPITKLHCLVYFKAEKQPNKAAHLSPQFNITQAHPASAELKKNSTQKLHLNTLRRAHQNMQRLRRTAHFLYWKEVSTSILHDWDQWLESQSGPLPAACTGVLQVLQVPPTKYNSKQKCNLNWNQD